MRNIERIAPIGQHRIQRREPAQPAVRLAQQQQDAASAENVATGKVRLDFAAIEAWKSEILLRTVWH
jgi:hypothetical protein